MTNNFSEGFFFKSGIFALIAGILYYFFASHSSETPAQPNTDDPIVVVNDAHKNEILPNNFSGETIHHQSFSLGYAEAHEQAAWVAWKLTRQQLNQAYSQRVDNFRADLQVSTQSALPTDYSGSGFDRGHLCPAADRGYDEFAMAETFLMSNISPQVSTFNKGIWRELEELTRDWARKYNEIAVISGPILSDKGMTRIGASEVSVPRRFYRVIAAEDKAIGFVLPNKASDADVMEFALSVDEVEAITGLDFFPNMQIGQNSQAEAAFQSEDWPIDKRRTLLRIEEWNQQ